MDYRKYIDNIQISDELDCLGVTLIDGVIKELKCYHFPKQKEKYGKCESTNEDIREYAKIKATEISELERSINLIVEKSNLKSEEISNIISLIQRYSKNNKILLTHLGVKKNGTKMSEIKMYFTLRLFSSAFDVCGEIQSFNNNYELIEIIYESINKDSADFEEQIRIANICEQFGYFPTLIGVNHKKNKYELKLYFELKAEKYQLSEICRNVIVILEKINKNGLATLIDLVNTYAEYGFFVRGFTNSIIGNVMRLYFAPIIRFL